MYRSRRILIRNTEWLRKTVGKIVESERAWGFEEVGEKEAEVHHEPDFCLLMFLNGHTYRYTDKSLQIICKRNGHPHYWVLVTVFRKWGKEQGWNKEICTLVWFLVFYLTQQPDNTCLHDSSHPNYVTPFMDCAWPAQNTLVTSSQCKLRSIYFFKDSIWTLRHFPQRLESLQLSNLLCQHIRS
jgi:hypothetical protein